MGIGFKGRSTSKVLLVFACVFIVVMVIVKFGRMGRTHEGFETTQDYTGGNKELAVGSMAGELIYTPQRTLYIMPSGPGAEIKMSYGSDSKTLNIAQNKVDIYQPLVLGDSLTVASKDAEFYGPKVLVSNGTTLDTQGPSVFRGVVSLSNVRANDGDIYIDGGQDLGVNVNAKAFNVTAGASSFNGIVNANNDLSVGGGVNINGGANIRGATSVGGALTVLGDASMNAGVSVSKTLNVDGDATFKGAVNANGPALSVSAQTATAFESRPEFKNGAEIDRIWLKKGNYLAFMSPDGNALASVLNTGDIRMNTGTCLGPENTGVCFDNSVARVNNGLNVVGDTSMNKDLNVKGKATINNIDISRTNRSGANYLSIGADGLMLADGTVIGAPASASNASGALNIGDWSIAADGNLLTFKLKNAVVAEVKANGRSNPNEFRLYHGLGTSNNVGGVGGSNNNTRPTNTPGGSVFIATRPDVDISLIAPNRNQSQ